jgi:glutathione peroxidase-family protein
MDKVMINGRKASPVFDYLKMATGNHARIPWP